jgi:hypothetical protein
MLKKTWAGYYILVYRIDPNFVCCVVYNILCRIRHLLDCVNTP